MATPHTLPEPGAPGDNDSKNTGLTRPPVWCNARACQRPRVPTAEGRCSSCGDDLSNKLPPQPTPEPTHTRASKDV
jgi:rRNA maturation protein Nop10